MRSFASILIAIAAITVATTGVARADASMCDSSEERATTGPALHESLAALPADIDLAVAVRGLSRLRTTPAGTLVRGALVDPVFDEVRGRWSSLSEAIGLTPDAALDAVLGERVIVVVRAVEGAPADWALSSDVSSRTEWLLRKQLKVSPRTIVGGQTLYTVERGALDLTFSRASVRGGSARLVLAPSGSALFERAVRGARPDEPIFANSRASALLVDDPGADIVLVARTPKRDNAWLTVGAKAEPHAVTLSLRATKRDEDAHRPARLRGWDEAVAARVASDAIVAVFDSGGSTLSEAASFIENFFPKGMLAPDDEAAQSVLAGREVAMLTPTDEGMALLAAVELLDLDRGAVLGDAAMDAMLESFGLRARGFDGMLPDAVRRVQEGPASIAWVYRESDPAQTTALPAGARPGWWLMTTSPSVLPDTAAAFGESFKRDAPGRVRALAFAYPGRLLESLGRAGVPTPPALEALRGVREVRWKELADDGVTTRAEISVLLQNALPASR